MVEELQLPPGTDDLVDAPGDPRRPAANSRKLEGAKRAARWTGGLAVVWMGVGAYVAFATGREPEWIGFGLSYTLIAGTVSSVFLGQILSQGSVDKSVLTEAVRQRGGK